MTCGDQASVSEGDRRPETKTLNWNCKKALRATSSMNVDSCPTLLQEGSWVHFLLSSNWVHWATAGPPALKARWRAENTGLGANYRGFRALPVTVPTAAPWLLVLKHFREEAVNGPSPGNLTSPREQILGALKWWLSQMNPLQSHGGRPGYEKELKLLVS